MSAVEPAGAGAPVTGEGFGVAVFVAGLAVFVVACTLALTGALNPMIVWVLGDELVRILKAAFGVAVGLVIVTALANGLLSRPGVQRIHIRPHRDHAHGVAEAVVHEALGHAAVGAGVRGTNAGIRARVYPDGSGWCDVPRGRTTLAGSIAIDRAGEYVAGPSGCESDRARAARELRQAPRRYRAQVSAEADRLVARHANSSFGRRVARSLERNGRFR